jgi:hypothetical protein
MRVSSLKGWRKQLVFKELYEYEPRATSNHLQVNRIC